MTPNQEFWVSFVASLVIALMGWEYPQRQMPLDYGAMIWRSVPLAIAWASVLAFSLFRHTTAFDFKREIVGQLHDWREIPIALKMAGATIWHPEFSGRNPHTREEVAVETKSSRRPGVLHHPGTLASVDEFRADVDRLYRDALQR